MRGSGAFRAAVSPGGALAGPWVRNALWRDARAVPSLDLQFADTKSLTDAISGQNLITFTRASSATYVGSDGLIKTATTNLLLRSEEIGTSPWLTNNTGAVTYTVNSTTAPTGSVTADRVTATADFAGPNQFVSVVSGFSYAFSFYVKAVTPGTLDAIRMECFSGRFAQFNITTRVFSGINAAITPSFVSIGNGWVRVQLLFVAPSTGSLAVAVYANTSADFYLWGAQLEQSSTVGEYIPTTSTINSAPRFDHNPTTGESLGLLVEEQRTNLLTYSEQFDNAAWVKLASTVTGNSIAAPDGTSTADKLVSDNGAQGQITHTVAMTASTVFTYSIFAKKAGFDFLLLRLRGNDGVDSGAYFNLAKGAVGTIEVNNTATIQAISDGWYRCSITRTSGSGATAPRQRAIATNADNTWSNGDGTSGVYLWGAQLEAGAFPTSYIPTTTATVTRSADVASITGTNFSSWYRQDEGTVFSSSQTLTTTGNAFASQISDNSYNNRVVVGQDSSNSVGQAIVSGAITLQPTANAIRTSNVIRQAFGLKANSAQLSVNGTASTEDTSGAMTSGLTRLDVGSDHTGNNRLNGTIRRLTYWPTRLANSTLQAITQ